MARYEHHLFDLLRWAIAATYNYPDEAKIKGTSSTQ
jgi:hypothetical protein